MSRIANELRSEIASLTHFLTGNNFLVANQLPQIKVAGPIYEVGWSKDGSNISPALRNIPYREVYGYFLEAQQYNFILPKGELVQFLYRFNNESLIEARVCYLPKPKDFDFEEGNSSLNPNEEIPLIRIDFSPSKKRAISHSATHMHLGYTEDCRIPTSAPVAPNTFMLFILRSFYASQLSNSLETVLLRSRCFDDSLLAGENKAVHFKIPGNIVRHINPS
jgi:hypothetical protein